MGKDCPRFLCPTEIPSFLASSRCANAEEMKANIPIGQLICAELRRQGKNNRWLAERINVNIRTVNKIFQKSVIDTQQLTLVSEALGMDFFRYYSEALGLASTVNDDSSAETGKTGKTLI